MFYLNRMLFRRFQSRSILATMKTSLSVLSFVFFVLQICFSDGKRNFEIRLESMNCTFNPKFVSSVSCIVDKSMKHPQAHADMQMIHEVKTMTYSMKIDLIKADKDHMNLLDVKNADGCSFLEGKLDGNILNVYRDMLAEAGNLPKCPIPKDYHFVFNNITIDVERFPPFLPEASFQVLAETRIGKEFFYWLEVTGSVIAKKK